jgi:uncharacterized protein YqjF (DUF2071 family)
MENATCQARPFLTAEWRCLAMLNFPVEAALLRRHLPAGTEIEFYQGRTFLSVVGFRFLRTRVLGIPVLCHRDFDEVNLRFYVRHKAGHEWRRGVVFLKEIVCRRLIAFVARTVYNENYVVMPLRSRVELHPAGDNPGSIHYEWHCGDRWHSLSARTSGSACLSEPGSEEEFITEHYWGYSRQRDGSTMEYQVEHPRWRVWKTATARYDADVGRLYDPEFAPYLGAPPSSAFVADGSPVVVRRGRRLS